MTTHASAYEINFDCLVGPTHHFGGLSFGNIASTKNRAKTSSPKKAALQGLEKMRWLANQGFRQAILPPHERPHIKSLRMLGFMGADEDLFAQAHKHMPSVFLALCSSAAMWAANAAIMSPSTDSLDNKVHISPANLITMLHRSIEANFTFTLFLKIFSDERLFTVHPPLLRHDLFADEGAANHNRLCPSHSARGLQIFVYGRESSSHTRPTNFPARQTKLANDSIALRHQLHKDYFLNIKQNPYAIDKGVFHNDVACVVNEDIMLCHEMAFHDQANTLELIRRQYEINFGLSPRIIEIKEGDLSLDDAVSSYLFNSQLLSAPNGRILLFAPTECETNERVQDVIKQIIDKHGIAYAEYFDVSESMANGGGPACLRLRMVLNDREINALPPSIFFSDQQFDALAAIINNYYVDELSYDMFFDRDFLLSCKKALDEITSVLGIGSIYDFQQTP